MKINLKDIKNILLGILIMFSVYNAYFSISGNLPPVHSEIPVVFTIEIAAKAAIVGFLFSLVFFYFVFLRKGSEKITLKDIIKILAGAFFFGMAGHLKSYEFELAGAYFILTSICSYLGFLKK